MKTLSFVIPVYNEEKRISKTFSALKKFKTPKELKLQEVIFVDDGSKDKTVATIKASKKTIERKLKAKVRIVSYGENRGKGYAVKQGMLTSNAAYTLFFDADISTPLEEINKFVPFILNKADVIIGTRKNGKSTVLVHQPKFREVLGKGFTLITKTFLRLKVTDFTCGFKMFSKEAKNNVFSRSVIETWGYDAEILYLSNKFKYTIFEKAVTWSNDQNTKVKLYKAIPQTFWELFLIYWNHEIKPALLYVGKNLNIINRQTIFVSKNAI